MKKLLGLTAILAITSSISFADANLSLQDSEDALIPGHGHRVVCRARNRRGQIFQAVGKNQYRVQQRAIQNCYQAGSQQCMALGCRFH